MIHNKSFHFDFKKLFIPFLGIMIMLLIASNSVLAQDNIDEVAKNVVEQSSQLPGLITGLSYLLGIIFAFYGIIKTKEHVENPNGTALRYPVISFLIGGALFALPIVYESMDSLINPGEATEFNYSEGKGVSKTNANAAAGNAIDNSFSTVLASVAASIQTLPGLVTAVAYLIGLLFGVSGLLKIKEHVEEPQRAPMKDGVIRLVVGGMLFAIPTVMSALFLAVTDGGSIMDQEGLREMLFVMAGNANEGTGDCQDLYNGNTLGAIACKLFVSTSPFGAFATAIAYLFGVFIALWGILRIPEHVANPQQVAIWDPLAKLLVAGALFALPNIVSLLYNTVTGDIGTHTNTLEGTGRVAAGPLGLDGMLSALMNDAFLPVSILVNWFGIAAGFVLIFIGITRLMKSAQEGARGPGGIGTIMTFITGGALAAFSPMVTALSTSLFAAEGANTKAKGALNYKAGMSPEAIERAHSVIDAVLLFVMLLGLISIVRGIFIMRGVAEGNSQASSMAGVTHLIGGALAVNLGPLLNAVQVTLQIFDLGLGITFE